MENKIQKATQAQKDAMVSAEDKKPTTMKGYLKMMEPEIAKALPSVMTPERFTRIAMSALSSNRDLANSTPSSFLAALMTSAQLGLEVNTPLGHAYLIPFKNYKKGGIIETQFQLGYRGLIDLAYRSGDIAIIQAHTVYENDEFTYEFGLEPVLRHVPAKSDRGKPVYFYAMFKLKDGGFGFEVMSYDDAREHGKKYSKSFKNGPWQTNFEEMAKKTVLKQALKYAPLKSDFVKQLVSDESVKNDIGVDMSDMQGEYVDDWTVIETDNYTIDADTGEVVIGEEKE